VTESEYTRKLVKKLRRRLPKSVIFKFNDRLTGGIPDLSVTLNGLTTWLEAKHLKDQYVSSNQLYGMIVEVKPARDVPRLQWENLWRLRRGYLIVYTSYGHAVTQVRGSRESVLVMRLQLSSTGQIVDQIAEIVKTQLKEEKI